MKLDILAFGAHPDDVELGCAATIAKEISLGKKVGIVDLTRGELGTRGSAELRDKEAAKAAEILGIVLTKRGNGSESETALAGFPHHSLNTYLPKLVKAGLRVAICDQ